jgi:transcriptional regulator with XRE-family HTH domain
MPAKSPANDQAIERLGVLGARLRQHRKTLRVSASAAAEAAGLSRVTLHRIEKGEPSVTIGAYLSAMGALGLQLDMAQAQGIASYSESGSSKTTVSTIATASIPDQIRLADYPQLRELAWHIQDADAYLTPREALDLYERNWRHADPERMEAHERALVDALAKTLGGGRLLV